MPTPSRDVDRAGWALTFEHSPVGMAVVALNGSFLQVNQSLCQILGYAAEQLQGMSFQEFTHPDDLEPDLDLLRECLSGQRVGYRLVKRYLHADGHLVWGDLSVALVSGEHGPLHFVSQILDISEQRAAKDRLELLMADLTAANHDLAQFAAVLSHDLKTPLSTVRASLELLADALPDALPEVRPDARVGAVPAVGTGAAANQPRALAERAGAAAERMSALIDAVLAYTTTDPRLRGVQGQTDELPILLPDVVAGALADVQLMLERGDAEVGIEPGLTTAPAVLASPALVRTVVVNLVSNAIKYRDPSRPLCIQIDAAADPTSPDLVLVTVRNDGPAIAPEERGRIFDLFARGQRIDGARSVPGFGIGLAACHRIVSWHGGRIWFAEPGTDPATPSEGQAAGVVVCFTLPRARDGAGSPVSDVVSSR